MLAVHEGEALTFLQQIEPGTVDCILTDPPYCNGGIKGSDRRRPTSCKIQQSQTLDKKPDFLGDTRDQHAFRFWLAMWMLESWRIAKDGAFMMCFMDWRNLTCAIDALQMAGFIYRGVFCWAKPNGRPQKNGFKNDVEFIVWGTKGKLVAPGGVDRYSPGHVLCQPMATSKRIHGTEKPIEVLEQLLTFVPDGGLVVDPFAGSGAVGEACFNLGLNYMGCELSSEYASLAKARLEGLCNAD